MRNKLLSFLLLLSIAGNANAFTSTKYIDKHIKINVAKEIRIVGASKITTVTTTKTDANGNVTSNTEKFVEDIEDSEYLRVLEQVRNNEQRIGALEEMYSDIETRIEAIRQDSVSNEMEFEDLVSNIESTRQEAVRVNALAEQKQVEVVQLAAEYQELANNYATQQSELSQAAIELADNKDSLLVILASQSEVNQKLSEYMVEFTNKMNNLKAEYEALKSAVELRAQAVSDAMDAKNLELESLESAGETMTQEYLEVLSELTTLNAQYTNALTQIEELNTEYDNHTHEIDGIVTSKPVH